MKGGKLCSLNWLIGKLFDIQFLECRTIEKSLCKDFMFEFECDVLTRSVILMRPYCEKKTLDLNLQQFIVTNKCFVKKQLYIIFDAKC